MTDTVNFTLLGAGYFCIPLNILELCSRIQLFGNRTILLPILKQDPSEYSNQSPVNYEVFKSHSWWEQTLFPELCEHQTMFSSVFSGTLSQPWVVSSLLCADQDSANYLMGTFCRYPEFFPCEALSSPVLCPMNYNCYSYPRLSYISWRVRAFWATPGFLLCPTARNSLWAVRRAIISLISFISCFFGISVFHCLMGSY